jgi:parallel beta-helix repeat protein
MSRVRLAAVVGVVVALNLAAISPARAATVEVFPGPNAIQNAVTAASAGDTLRIHAGTYNENVVVGGTKSNLVLQAFGDGPVIVDAGCGSFTTIDVNAGGVFIDALVVQGGGYYEVDFQGVAGGTVRRSVLRDTCGSSPGAYYGVNVFNTSGTVWINGSWAVGFGDAGFYVGGIQNPSAIVSVTGNTSIGSNRGIIMEDIVAASTVLVAGNQTRRNRAVGINAINAGIYLHNADGLTVDGNRVTDNRHRGIELDFGSSGNLVTNNTISGHTYDLSNLGTMNCFSGNTYTTSNGNLPACP